MDDASERPDDPLERVLAPVSVTDFLECHWERQPLHVERAAPARFASLVSSARLERLLGNTELRYPDVQLARHGDPVPVEVYTDAEERIVPHALVREHAAGATLVLSGAQERLDPLGELCRLLRGRLGMRCQANVYRSVPGGRGFGPHHDSHDVFILQVEGSKRFRFHAGGPELPLARERFDPARDLAGALTEEIVLAPGDTLYIPRGLMHDALASGEEASLHVTLGLFSVTVLDVLHDALDIAGSRCLELRRSVTASRAAPATSTGDRSLEDPGALLREALSPAVVAEAIEALRDAHSIGSRADGAGWLTRPGKSAALAHDSVLVVLDGVPACGERRGARLVLALPGRVLEFGEPVAGAVAALLAARRGRIDALAVTDPERRLALGRRLLDEGVVELDPPGSAGRT